MRLPLFTTIAFLAAAMASTATATTLAAVVSKDGVTLAADTRATNLFDPSDYREDASKIIVVGSGAAAFSGVADLGGLFSVADLVKANCQPSDGPKEWAAAFGQAAVKEMQKVADTYGYSIDIRMLASEVWFCGMEDGEGVVYVVTTRVTSNPDDDKFSVACRTTRRAPEESEGDVILRVSGSPAPFVPENHTNPITMVESIVKAGINDPDSQSGGDVVTCVVDGSGASIVQ
jgi:hypothetical protein